MLKEMHSIKDILVFGMSIMGLLLGVLPSFAQDWECRECPKRTLGVFEVAVPPAGSDTTLAYGDWAMMRMVSGGVLETFMDHDPGSDCLGFYDTQRIENLVMGFIRDFEKRKRDENFGMAIEVKDEKTEVIPQRRKVGVNETVDVTFRVSDCDDQGLKDRIVVPKSTGGRFLTSKVPKTDVNGEVTLTFHAGEKTGKAKLMGVYSYRYPFGKEAVPAQGEETIEIVDHYLSAPKKRGTR